MGLTTNLEEFDRFIAQQIHDFQRPRVGGLTHDELEDLAEKHGVLAPRVAQLAELCLHTLGKDLRELSDVSYGVAGQLKTIETLGKLMRIEERTGGAQDAARASTDAELFARLPGLRAIAEHGQIADSVEGAA